MKAESMARRLFFLFLGIALGFSLSGCAGPAYKPAGPVKCPAEVEWEVAKEAEISFFGCSVKPYAGWQNRPTLQLEVEVQNKAPEARRFRVQLILPEEGLAGGGLLPETGNPPVLATGKVAKGVYPVNTQKIPGKVLVIVKTISVE
jgi:hypothetical protein